jgi:hypothetical protein
MSNRSNAMFVGLLAAAALGLGVSAASAQGYPNKPVHMIVPYPAGGAWMPWRACSRRSSATPGAAGHRRDRAGRRQHRAEVASRRPTVTRG